MAGQPVGPVGINVSLGSGEGRDLKWWVLQELFSSLFFYMNDFFFPYFCFSPSGFHHLHRRHHNKIGSELCSALYIYVCALGDSGKKTVNCTLVLVESYAGFRVKTKLWALGVRSVCNRLRTSKLRYQTWKFANLCISIRNPYKQASRHASEELELGRWCVTQSRSPEIVAPLIIKKWDSGLISSSLFLGRRLLAPSHILHWKVILWFAIQTCTLMQIIE